jgi:endonuclease/exonuclease/phosphatase family metal-dependent hydrolase
VVPGKGVNTVAQFEKPKFDYVYNVADEIQRLRDHKVIRKIPDRSTGSLLAATWNIANLGAHDRRDQDFALIGEILSWFDIMAVQECRDNFRDLEQIVQIMPPTYRYLMSDAAGNSERMVFLYDGQKLSLLEEVGEITLPPASYKRIKLPGIDLKFEGFDRSPYLASFATGQTSFTFVNAHLYYGISNNDPLSIARRSLETYAVAYWAKERVKPNNAFTRELAVMGDMNMPKSDAGDPIFKALTKLGLEVPEHSTQIASNIANDANYDQIAFLPSTTKNAFTGLKGVYDYDDVIFPDLWQDGKNTKNFKAYLRYYISDHRPMWVQLRIQ